MALAKSGSVISLANRAYGPLVIQDQHFDRPITINVNGATIESIVIRNSSNIIIDGGAVVGGPVALNYGISIDHARSVNIRNMLVTNMTRGLWTRRSQYVGIFNNRFQNLRVDGVNVAESQNLVIEGNVCRDFNPIPSTYDALGNKLVDGDHPDCIQAWSRPNYTPTGNIVVRGNSAIGNMQGIFFGNNIVNGVDEGGFDNIVIENNYVNNSWGNGITIADGRNVRISYNELHTISGSVYDPVRRIAVETLVRLIRPINGIACGNIVSSAPTSFGTNPC